jgi:serine protease Do
MGAAGPAARDGVQVGDIILLVGGQPVGTAEQFAQKVRNTAPGTEVVITVLRHRTIHEIRVRLGCAPSV